MPGDELTRKPKVALRGMAIVLVAIAVFGLLIAIAVSPVPMRGAEIFGAIANKIKGHPGTTAAVVSVAIALLWLGVGILAATQEWFAARRVR